MRPSTVLALALPAALAKDQKCDFRPVNGGNPIGQNAKRWTITGKDIGEEVAGDAFCNGIKDNLHCLTADWECKSDGNRGLKLTFLTSDWCSGKKINEAWWFATKNGFGPLFCEGRNA